MTQTVVNRSGLGAAHKATLRSRLLIRLLGLTIIMLLFLLVIFFKTSSPGSQFLLPGILFIAGISIIFSILALVQKNLLDPLGYIRSWAKKVLAGRYADPIPAPAYSAFAELADDLNQLGRKLSKGGVHADTRGMLPEGVNHDSLQILYEMASSINSARGLDDLLTRFLYILKRVTNARGATVWIASGQERMDLVASNGIDESLILPDRPEMRRCLTERAITEGKIWVDSTLDKPEQIAGRKLFKEKDMGLVSIPLRFRSKILGVINLFLPTDIISGIDSIKPLLNNASHHLSIAIEKARSEEETQQHLINDERTRIAHDLHDSLAQSLASIRYQVRVLDETLHQGDESTTWQQLERIENSLDEANTELRELIANFRAPVYKRGLLDAIEKIVGQFRSETGIRTYLQKEWSKVDLPKDVQIQVLRIIREALWNIRKHSEAKTVRIMMRHNNKGAYNILIEDDGIGFGAQVNGAEGDHMGLSIMQERAARFGAELRVESEPGEGTRVVLVFNDPPLGDTG